MILVTSAAFVNSEFQIEFGKIPPSFLPVGNKRLFEHQVDNLKKYFPCQKIFISSPLGYKIAQKDLIYMASEGVEIIQIDPNLSLGNSIARFIDEQEPIDAPLKILHGDTLIYDLPIATNCIGTAKTLSGYDWEVEEISDGGEIVWCGFFSIERIATFRECINGANGEFVKAVHLYHQQCPLTYIEIARWHDYGHLNTYFQNRTFLTTERSFNQLKIAKGTIKKYGSPIKKIKAESNWFKNIPPELRVYIPNYIDDGLDFYELEYLPLPPLNELFVHGKNIELFWVKVFNLCDQFFEKCTIHQIEEDSLSQIELSSIKLIDEKTWERFSQFLATNDQINPNIDILYEGVRLPSLMDMIKRSISLAVEIKPFPGISHGDFCLSNILFDSRVDRLKVIDPRGLDGWGNETIFGDINYDLAKLTHSIVGLYDFIVSGAFDVNRIEHEKFDEYELTIYIDNRIKNIQRIFLERTFLGKLSPKEIMPITMLLFISMLPLHQDNPKRQLGLLATAISIYKNYIQK
ncbi:hypothetical protein G6732_00085 [Polynucleobacter paneuropaeus]|nr:hypothetical protein [Polynucleobacter paneuropaeus]